MTKDNLLSQDDHIEIDENKDYLAELVGEGKKFKDEQALAKAKAYSDAHIAILERQNEEYRQIALKNHEAATAGAKLQDLLDKLEAQQQLLASRETQNNSNEDKKPAIDITQIESLVSSKITQHEQTRKEQENYNQVKSKLMEQFGNNFKSVLKEQSDALGLTDDEVNAMARKNPTLFMKTFDLNKQSQNTGFQGLPRNTTTFSPKPEKKRTWSYYLDLKNKDPKAWLDKKIAVQMEKDAQLYGKDFYDI